MDIIRSSHLFCHWTHCIPIGLTNSVITNCDYYCDNLVWTRIAALSPCSDSCPSEETLGENYYYYTRGRVTLWNLNSSL